MIDVSATDSVSYICTYQAPIPRACTRSHPAKFQCLGIWSNVNDSSTVILPNVYVQTFTILSDELHPYIPRSRSHDTIRSNINHIRAPLQS